MKDLFFRSEGTENPNDEAYLGSVGGLKAAQKSGAVLQARCVMCDAGHNLHVSLGALHGIIPREETALGVRDGSVRDVAIITRVNKPVCFKVETVDEAAGIAVLSRAAAQRDCRRHLFSHLRVGDILPAKITHLEPFGAFADIGCGLISMIAIDNISVSRIRHPADRFTVGMEVLGVVRDIDRENYRITLSHKELLGTWMQNAERFEAGQTVSGIVRSVENYGIFIELAPNLAGLAEYTDGVEPGRLASVYIKSILPDKMKIKLALVDTGEFAGAPEKPEYFIKEGHLSRWQYSPDGCPKQIETVFDEQLVEL